MTPHLAFIWEDDIPLSGCVQETAPFLHPVEELVEDQRGLLAERLSLEQGVDPLVADAARFARQNAGGRCPVMPSDAALGCFSTSFHLVSCSLWKHEFL